MSIDVGGEVLPAERELAAMRTMLASVRMPAEYRRLRSKVYGLVEELSYLERGGRGRLSAKRLADIERIKKQIKIAKIPWVKARDAWQSRLGLLLAPHRAIAARAVLGAVALLDAAEAILRESDQVAREHHVELDVELGRPSLTPPTLRQFVPAALKIAGMD